MEIIRLILEYKCTLHFLVTISPLQISKYCISKSTHFKDLCMKVVVILIHVVITSPSWGKRTTTSKETKFESSALTNKTIRHTKESIYKKPSYFTCKIFWNIPAAFLWIHVSFHWTPESSFLSGNETHAPS